MLILNYLYAWCNVGLWSLISAVHWLFRETWQLSRSVCEMLFTVAQTSA